MTAIAERAPVRERASAPSRDWPVVAAPAALAAVLVLVGISGRSLGFDEAASVTIAAQHGDALCAAAAAPPARLPARNPPARTAPARSAHPGDRGRTTPAATVIVVVMAVTAKPMADWARNGGPQGTVI